MLPAPTMVEILFFSSGLLWQSFLVLYIYIICKTVSDAPGTELVVTGF